MGCEGGNRGAYIGLNLIGWDGYRLSKLFDKWF